MMGGDCAVSHAKALLVAALARSAARWAMLYILYRAEKTILPASFIGARQYGGGAWRRRTISAYFLSTVLVSVVCEIEARGCMPSTIFPAQRIGSARPRIQLLSGDAGVG